jgi:hypothetical protein
MSEFAEHLKASLLRRLKFKVLLYGGALVVLVIFLLISYGLSGRGERLDTAYGKRRGIGAEASVNGTKVLGEMFSRAGHNVRTINRLSPGLNDRVDVIVWIPDGFGTPDKKQREFLENWLSQGRGRTLIYVGRDYDSAPEYWKAIQPQVAAKEGEKCRRYEAESRAAYDALRSKMPKSEYARWFTAKGDGKKHRAKTLEGPWAEGINASQAEIMVEGVLEPPVEADRTTPASDPPVPEKVTPLLWSDQGSDGFSPKDAIVSRVTDKGLGTGQVIVVANGSFVLNYPLVNHEHRKLAGKLIDECGPGQNVAFLESSDGGPEVLDKEPESGERGLFEILQVWPLNAIVIHLTLLGIIYCLARSPIFGRPKELPGEAAADFGKHVTALGRLMGRTKDRAYAEQRVQQYLQQGKRASGKSHLKGS